MHVVVHNETLCLPTRRPEAQKFANQRCTLRLSSQGFDNSINCEPCPARRLAHGAAREAHQQPRLDRLGWDSCLKQLWDLRLGWGAPAACACRKQQLWSKVRIQAAALCVNGGHHPPEAGCTQSWPVGRMPVCPSTHLIMHSNLGSLPTLPAGLPCRPVSAVET